MLIQSERAVSRPLSFQPAGTRTQENGQRSNSILAGLSEEDRRRIEPHLVARQVPQHAVLHEAGGDVQHVHFVDSGLISLLAVMDDGRASEAAMVGPEGVVGLSAFHRTPVAPVRAVAQVPTTMRSIPAIAFVGLLRDCPMLDIAMHRYAYSMFSMISLASACNRRHSAEQRLARWLLMAHDRVGASLPLTHHFIGDLLGVRRSTVTVIAERFRADGLIRYTRGVISIWDEVGLQARSCGCYPHIQQAFDRVRLSAAGGS